MLNTMRCAKCGLTQLVTPTCKSCGTASGHPSRPPSLRLVPPSTPAAPIRSVVEPLDAPPAPPTAETSGPPSSFAEGTEGPQTARLSFHGIGGSLFGIHLVNIFRTLITLGVYHFWGKVRVRAYLLSESEFEGDRFAYHGTGRELLTGSIKAGFAFGVLIAWFNALPFLPGPGAQLAGAAIAYGLFLVLVPVAMVGARRYRLSRTSWRNIRFSFRGRTRDFVALFVGHFLLTVLTLGFYYPIFATKRYAFLVSHSYLGNQSFGFDGRGRDLFGSFLLAVLLTLPTLGLCWFWFLARKQRYWWDHTSFGAARFHSAVTGGRLLRLHAGNLLLIVLTLGLGWAWVVVRRVRFAFAYLAIEGPLDLGAVRQEAQDATATGDGLDSLMDVDSGFAVG